VNILSTAENNQSIDGKSGFVVVVGRPSAGKSTLINAVCGEKVSIVSSVPQTTRNTIRGILTEARGQLVFLDTPGFHQATKKMNLRLRGLVLEHIHEADALLYLIDSTRPPGPEEDEIATVVSSAKVPKVCIVTKCDAPDAKPELAEAFLVSRGLTPLLRLSNMHQEPANTGGSGETRSTESLMTLLSVLFETVPAGHPFYPPEYYTDQDPSFRIAEILREAAILNTSQEVPHSIFVEVADLEAAGYDDDGQPTRVWARCFIFVERESQKGIVVGKEGKNIKRIRSFAERRLKEIFDYRIELKLQVKVRSKWRQSDKILGDLLH